MLDSAINYARSNKQTHLSKLCTWLRIPSISTLPNHAEHVREAAEFAQRFLQEMGMSRAEIHETKGHPVVYAEWLEVKDTPTLLIYGHFDVQPVDSDEEWTHPPFEPTIDGDNLYARGASDDKGQLFAILAALESYFKSSSTLPVNVKILLEGEEEVTSPNLAPYIRKHVKNLQADAVLIADQEMLDLHHPIIMWGMRGILYLEIEVAGPGYDLHSGTFGGSVDNPLNVLVRLLGKLQDGETRKVLIPGFYENVEELGEEERALISQAPINDDIGKYLTGAPQLGGEADYPLAERVSVRPTMEIHGITGGFTDAGAKTVIPSKATAKVSLRLVPKQTPDVIFRSVKTYLQSLCPPTVKLDLRVMGKAYPVKINYKSPAVQAAAIAYEKGFGHKPIYLRGGGSLPIVWDLIDLLSKPGEEIPIVLIGFGLPDDRTHSPNEKIHIPNFYNGIETAIHYLDLFKTI